MEELARSNDEICSWFTFGDDVAGGSTYVPSAVENNKEQAVDGFPFNFYSILGDGLWQ